uniref:DUF4939 domain-containing protein n=1 Tax=Naja naja TaxID=35670 RepID=A0A8C6XXB2_NAJNA
MDQLRADNAELSQQVALLTAQVAQMQAVWPHRRCPEAVLDKFDGSLTHFPAFWGQCQLYMSLRPKDFPTDQDKVGFLISLLSGSAARWAMPLLTQPNQVSNRCNDGWRLHPFPARQQPWWKCLWKSSCSWGLPALT